VDSQTYSSRPIPDDIRAKLEPYLDG
jgi:hypothetical protein